jgi:beta-glucosidase
MKKLASFLFALTIICFTTHAQPRLGQNPIKDVVAAMTTEEKVNLLIGMGIQFPDMPTNMQGPVVGQTNDRVAGAAGTTFAIPRLGIPSIVLADGPAGLRIQPFRKGDSSVSYYCTAFPIGTLLASSWDTVLVQRVGAAMGNEVREYGVDILLAPALNNQRNPLGGRNFEYYSEDPLIAGRTAAAMVNGIQSQGVGTSIKHFAANNHEFNRNTMNVVVGERALRELYLKGFQITLQHARPWTVMSSYNRINGTYTSESPALLTTVLRDEWKFRGFVMTDWFGGKDAVAQMKAGNDMLMPGTVTQQEALMEALRNHTLDVQVLNRNVERVLQVILMTPSFKKYNASNHPDLKAHAQVARAAAAEGMVLLRNEGHALPIAKNVRRIALFGNAAYDMVTGGTGSGDVNEAYTISLSDGLKDAGFLADAQLQDIYTGYIAEQKARRPKQANTFLLPPPVAEMNLDERVIDEMAGVYDLALVTIGRNSGEFADRKLEGDFNFTATEKELISHVAAAFHRKNKKMVVILNTGGVVETMSWRNNADAILLAWQPGQEAGHAITDILTGRSSPSGHLAVSFPASYEDVPTAKGFPGRVTEAADTSDHSMMAGARAAEVVYDEGIFNGYRFYESDKNTAQLAPAYEFGFGLSYTSFGFDQMMVSSKKLNGSVTVSVRITNTGNMAGKEVVQLYVSAPGKTMDLPQIELKAFGKTGLLMPGQSQTLRFTLDARDLASFDEGRESWVAEAGTYMLRVGASSKDIRQTGAIVVDREIITEKVHKL